MTADARAIPRSSDTLSHQGGFDTLEDELHYTVAPADIKWSLPAAVSGTFFRIGPGRNKIGGQEFGHWFDGDGMLHAVSFTDQGVVYRNRYVRTPKYLAETRANRIVKRSFGHNAPGGDSQEHRPSAGQLCQHQPGLSRRKIVGLVGGRSSLATGSGDIGDPR